MPPLGPTEIDAELGEVHYKGDVALEERYTDEIIDVIKRATEKRFGERVRPARRDAHAFDTACVQAIFRVDPNLHSDLRQGVFVPGREYAAWIRFSNGNCIETSPRAPDARGMAIKLMGVSGDKLMSDEKETQDFILISHPRFFVDDLKPYKATLNRFLRGTFWDQWVVAPLKLGSLRSIAIAFRVNALFVTNPLFIRYWSMTPYRLGLDPARKLAVKYAVKPQGEKPPFFRRLAAFFGRGFAQKKEIGARLAGAEMRFDFYIQRYIDARTPIEDSTVEWLERVSKLERVAEIVIPAQAIISPERDRFCDNLSFSPWHGLPEHKPLGLVNRVRRRVYLSISEHRHALNEIAPQEPTRSTNAPGCPFGG
jgi:hypothetical protein